MTQCAPMTDLCPPDFCHQPPEGYTYEFKSFKRNVTSIWIRNHAVFSYTADPVRSIWGFYDRKKKCYYAPVNASKSGDSVDIVNTTPYSAMQLNLNPLQRALL